MARGMYKRLLLPPACTPCPRHAPPLPGPKPYLWNIFGKATTFCCSAAPSCPMTSSACRLARQRSTKYCRSTLSLAPEGRAAPGRRAAGAGAGEAGWNSPLGASRRGRAGAEQVRNAGAGFGACPQGAPPPSCTFAPAVPRLHLAPPPLAPLSTTTSSPPPRLCANLHDPLLLFVSPPPAPCPPAKPSACPAPTCSVVLCPRQARSPRHWLELLGYAGHLLRLPGSG